MTELTELAARIAAEAHQGQTRWDKVTPYISHPAAVARILIERGFDEDSIAAAWLHDVIEDTPLTRDDLVKRGIPDYVASAVEVLSKKDGQDYLDYILQVKADVIAKDVKIADIEHNMSCFDKKKGSLYQKYQLALYILQED